MTNADEKKCFPVPVSAMTKRERSGRSDRGDSVMKHLRNIASMVGLVWLGLLRRKATRGALYPGECSFRRLG